MVETLLPNLVDKLQPYWADFNTSGGAVFGDYLAKHGEQVSEDLLTVTDARAEASDRPTIIRAYRSVRASAGKHMQAALPNVGEARHEVRGLRTRAQALPRPAGIKDPRLRAACQRR